MVQKRTERFELKYFVSERDVDMIRLLIAPFVQSDPYARNLPERRYTVRSLYYDTPGLRFYWEKEAGLKIRKKIRIRAYNEAGPDSQAFLEIKRKHGITVCKERVGCRLSRSAEWMSPDFAGELPTQAVPQRGWAGSRASGSNRSDGRNEAEAGLSPASRTTLQRVLFLKEVLRLRPAVLIVYEREPYVGTRDSRVRITIDSGLRSLVRPKPDEIASNRGMRYITDRQRILEIKFDRVMPQWVRPLTARLDRCHQPISKYCRGIDRWS